MKEAAFVVFLQLTGLAVLGGLRPRLPWGFALASSFLVGLSVFVVVCWVFLITPLGVFLPAVLGVQAALCVGPLVLRRRPPLSAAQAAAGAAVGATGAAVSMASQWLNPAILSIDSWWLVEPAALLASTGTLAGLEPQRLLHYPVLVVLTQFPAGEFARYYLISVFVMASLSGLACLGWFTAHTSGLLRAGPGVRAAVTAAAVAFTATTYFIIWQAFYINGHMLFAGLFLILCASLWLAVLSRRWVWVVPAAVVIPPLVLARLEAPLVLAVALLPFLVSDEPPDRAKIAVAAPFVLVGGIWYGVVLRYGGDGVVLSDASVLAMTALIVGVGVLLAVQRVEPLRPLLRRAPGLVVAGLLLALLAMVATRPEHMVESMVALTTNAVQLGLWGPFWVVLLPLLLLLVGARRLPWERFLLLPVGAFFLIVIDLAYFRVPYRLRWGDSGNRMFTHIALLAVFYVAVKCASLLAARDPEEHLAQR